LEFIPEEPGEHIIDVKKLGKPVDGSPFRVLVQEEEPDAPKVGDNVSAAYDLPDIVLPRDLKDLEASLTRPNGKKEPIKCTSTPENTLGLEFTPEQPGKHIIDVKKNGKPVKGSPFEVLVEKEETMPPKVGDICNIDQVVPDVILPKDLKDLEANLTRPTGKKESIKCSATPDGTLGLEFTPTEPGKHLVDVTKKGKPVEGSPFVVLVEDEEPNAPKMGSPCDLDYDVPNVVLPKDLKDLTAMLTRPSGKEEPITCTSTPDDHLGLEFTPESPGEHIINVKKKGKPVEGSPFKVMVAEEEPTMPVVGDVCDLDYAVPDVTLPKDLKELEAILTRPSGKKEPINCTSTPDEHLGLEFTPQESGEHVIDVKKKGKPVTGSPSRVMVEEEQDSPKVGDKCDLGYDIPGVTSVDDLKDLKATVKRPSGKKEPIPCTMKPDKTLGLEFTPEEPGRHIIDITKKGRPVKGSPFEVIVEETLPPAKPTVGSKCEVDYDIPDVTLPRDLKDLQAKVTRPTGKQEAIECTITPENTLGLEFTPEESGKHIVDVTKRGKPVKGSPFEITVEEEEPTGSKPTVGHKCDVGFDIPEITLPRDLKLLKATLIRPDCTEEEIKCTCSPDKTLGLEFTPKQPGEHKIVVKKHGKPVKGSPFIINVGVDTDTAPEQKPTVGNKCEVDFDIPDVHLPNDLKNLKAKLTRPSGIKEDIPCTCSPDNTLGLDFIPNEPGTHKIEVTKNGKPVKGSPFIVMVEEDTGSDSKPTVGHKCDVDFDIPDVNLPQDLKVLNATLTRPNGVKEPVKCTCTPDNTLGLEFTPEEPGKHGIEVTKNKRPVKGSPFVVIVEEDQNPPSKPSVGHKCDVDFDIPDINLP
jgi:filamin